MLQNIGQSSYRKDPIFFRSRTAALRSGTKKNILALEKTNGDIKNNRSGIQNKSITFRKVTT